MMTVFCLAVLLAAHAAEVVCGTLVELDSLPVAPSDSSEGFPGTVPPMALMELDAVATPAPAVFMSAVKELVLLAAKASSRSFLDGVESLLCEVVARMGALRESLSAVEARWSALQVSLEASIAELRCQVEQLVQSSADPHSRATPSNLAGRCLESGQKDAVNLDRGCGPLSPGPLFSVMQEELKVMLKCVAVVKPLVKAKSNARKLKAKQVATAMAAHRDVVQYVAEEVDAKLESETEFCTGDVAVAAASRDCWRAALFLRQWLVGGWPASSCRQCGRTISSDNGCFYCGPFFPDGGVCGDEALAMMMSGLGLDSEP